MMQQLPYTVVQRNAALYPHSVVYFVQETGGQRRVSRDYPLDEAAHLANWLIERHLGYPAR